MDGYYECELSYGGIRKGCYKNGDYHGPRLEIFYDGSIEYSENNNGQKTGISMFINTDKTDTAFGSYADMRGHGEWRFFRLFKIGMWNQGKCTDDDL